MRKIELILAISFITLLLLGFFVEIPFSLAASIAYVYAGFYLLFTLFLLNNRPVNDILTKEFRRELTSTKMITSVFLGYLYGLTIISLLYSLLHLPGESTVMLVPIVSHVLVIVVSLVKRTKHKAPFYGKVILRSSIMLMLVLGYFIQYLLIDTIV